MTIFLSDTIIYENKFSTVQGIKGTVYGLPRPRTEEKATPWGRFWGL